MSATNLAKEFPEINAVQPPQDSMIVIRDPGKVLKEATKAAETLKKIIDNKPKKIILNGKTYLENADWLTVARFYGITARIRSTKFVSYGDGEFPVRGFEATAEAYLVERSEVISTAESMCLQDEPNWKTKPLFQIRSMAQTRACSRVLRQVLGWVVVLAGYADTPAEEMEQAQMLALALCYECGDEIRTKGELEDSKGKFGISLCRVCYKTKLAKEKAGANRDLTPELSQSVQQAQYGRRKVAERDGQVEAGNRGREIIGAD